MTLRRRTLVWIGGCLAAAGGCNASTFGLADDVPAAGATTTPGATEAGAATTGDATAVTTTTTASDATGGAATSTASGADVTTGDATSAAGTTGSEVPPRCDAPAFSGSTPAPAVPGCEAVTGQSGWCVVLTELAVFAVGLDDGEVCQGVTLQSPVDAVGSGIAVAGGKVLVCGEDQGYSVSLTDGWVGSVPRECRAVTNWRGHVLEDRYELEPEPGDYVYIYDGESSWVTDAPAWSFAVEDIPKIRSIAASGETLYAAWYSGDHVGRNFLACGGARAPLEFAGYAGDMNGISAPDGDRLVTINYEVLTVLDAHTGAKVDEIQHGISPYVYGLACFVAE